MRYTKSDLRGIIDSFPDLVNQYPDDPDISYLNRLCSLTNKSDHHFSSEVGKDEYYMLYAFFLKCRDNGVKYDAARKKLISIFRSLNAFYSVLNHGGTYFGHQYCRILGYAEYSVYLLKDDSSLFSDRYDITAQKKIFISALHQYVLDEVNADYEVLEKEKQIERRELFAIVDEIDELITNSFYLKQAQRFSYSYY